MVSHFGPPAPVEAFRSGKRVGLEANCSGNTGPRKMMDLLQQA